MWLLLMGFQLMARHISFRQLLPNDFNSLFSALFSALVTVMNNGVSVIKILVIKTLFINTLAVA